MATRHPWRRARVERGVYLQPNVWVPDIQIRVVSESRTACGLSSRAVTQTRRARDDLVVARARVIERGWRR